MANSFYWMASRINLTEEEIEALKKTQLGKTDVEIDMITIVTKSPDGENVEKRVGRLTLYWDDYCDPDIIARCIQEVLRSTDSQKTVTFYFNEYCSKARHDEVVGWIYMVNIEEIKSFNTYKIAALMEDAENRSTEFKFNASGRKLVNPEIIEDAIRASTERKRLGEMGSGEGKDEQRTWLSGKLYDFR